MLNRKVLEEHTPILGICLGMQLFTKHSEEGDAAGLGWIDADSRRFRFDAGSGLRVPHVGWNTIQRRQPSALLEGVPSDQQFYFVHSYHVVCRDPDDVLTTTWYGHDFVSAVHRGNILGVQFHPEKSHEEGMRLIANFIKQFRFMIGPRIIPVLLSPGPVL